MHITLNRKHATKNYKNFEESREIEVIVFYNEKTKGK